MSSMNCDDCADAERHIDELLGIFAQIKKECEDALDSRVDNETALRKVIELINGYA